MKIGVDFDNTIVCFDPLFHAAALEKKLIPKGKPTSKTTLRDQLRAAGQEDEWTRLQGYVYGKLIDRADCFPGVKEFFQTANKKGIETYVVSHKTEKSALAPVYELHGPARTWLETQGFYRDTGLNPKNVFFETSMDLKMERIRKIGCDTFIDDLLEFLERADFPIKVKKFLFDPHDNHSNSSIERLASWNEAARRLLS